MALAKRAGSRQFPQNLKVMPRCTLGAQTGHAASGAGTALPASGGVGRMRPLAANVWDLARIELLVGSYLCCMLRVQ